MRYRPLWRPRSASFPQTHRHAFARTHGQISIDKCFTRLLISAFDLSEQNILFLMGENGKFCCVDTADFNLVILHDSPLFFGIMSIAEEKEGYSILRDFADFLLEALDNLFFKSRDIGL